MESLIRVEEEKKQEVENNKDNSSQNTDQDTSSNNTGNAGNTESGNNAGNNAGSAGKAFWQVDATGKRIQQNHAGNKDANNFIFEIIPVESK